ncbi:MAG: hypothetical protein V3U32_01925 [Anaerolineales bacterium]
MATNTERPRRFDLRETIPLATETLVRLAKKPKRSWIIPALTLITGIAFGVLMLELLVFAGPVSALAFEGELRSRLLANYGADPIVARIHELRLTIVEDVLGFDEGGGSGAPAIALLMQELVPTTTPKVTVHSSPTTSAADPTASPVPTDASATETSVPALTDTPPALTAVAAPIGYCSNLSITGMWVDGDDVEANVRNSGSKHVYLIKTVFEWPDVPDPAYVDYFELDKIDGDDKYNYNPTSSGNSPTISTGDYEKLSKGKTRRWETDFDDVPGGKIYGSFSVTLTFDVPGQDAHCSLSRSTFKAPPTPEATNTPEPVPTDSPTPTPTDTQEPTPTDTPDPAPTETATATDTPTPEP